MTGLKRFTKLDLMIAYNNIRIKKDDGNEIEVHSNFIVYRTRLETDQDMFVGARQDVLCRADNSFSPIYPNWEQTANRLGTNYRRTGVNWVEQEARKSLRSKDGPIQSWAHNPKAA